MVFLRPSNAVGTAKAESRCVAVGIREDQPEEHHHSFAKRLNLHNPQRIRGTWVIVSEGTTEEDEEEETGTRDEEHELRVPSVRQQPLLDEPALLRMPAVGAETIAGLPSPVAGWQHNATAGARVRFRLHPPFLASQPAATFGADA